MKLDIRSIKFSYGRPMVITLTVVVFIAGFVFHLYGVRFNDGEYDMRITNRRHYYSGLGINIKKGLEIWHLTENRSHGPSAKRVLP